MTKLIVNKQNQCTVTIPIELVEALKWKKGNRVLISKAPGQNYLIIENISDEKRDGKKVGT